jgi:hypothetical protein
MCKWAALWLCLVRRGAALFLLCLPLAAAGQDVLDVQPKQCVWRAGDDAGWAASALNESEWRPLEQWKLKPGETKIWIRCHADLSDMETASGVVAQVQLYAAYELYLNGEKIGGAGNLDNGNFSMNVVRQFQLPRSSLREQQATIALRITYKLFGVLPTGPLPAMRVTLGNAEILRDRRSTLVLAQTSEYLTNAIGFGIIWVIGFVMLGLRLYDQSRRELLLLTVVCLAIPVIYLNYFCAAALLNYPLKAYIAFWALSAIVANASRCLFFFAMAKRRVPVFFWILIGLGILTYSTRLVDMFLPARIAEHGEAFRIHWLEQMSLTARIGEFTAPFFAFWPYGRLARRMRLIAGLCMAWGVSMIVFFAVLLASSDVAELPHFRPEWGRAVANVEAFSTLAVIVALLGLLFREQQQTAEDRAMLAGEMQAAREIQRMLAPGVVKTAPGAKIHVAFHPMRDVGGDFFLCPVLPDGRQRVLMGDVSGKGSAAAMTAALVLGGAQARDADTPGNLLSHLNRVLRESHVGGFATCVCADLAADGAVTMANAGHLSPYRHSEEVQMQGNLPLGLSDADAVYEESRLQLEPGETLTFLSDGVVEARDVDGQLFGFERTREISGKAAEEIAEAAKQFGQEDDITVLTLTRVGASAAIDPSESKAATVR